MVRTDPGGTGTASQRPTFSFWSFQCGIFNVSGKTLPPRMHKVSFLADFGNKCSALRRAEILSFWPCPCLGGGVPPPLTIEDGGPKHPRTHSTFHQTLIVPRLSLQFVVQLQTTLYVVAFNPSQRWVRGVCLRWVYLARGGPKGPGFCCVFSFQDRPATSNETQGNCILTGYPPANQAKLQKDTPKIRPPTAQSAGDRETVKPFSHGVKR